MRGCASKICGPKNHQKWWNSIGEPIRRKFGNIKKSNIRLISLKSSWISNSMGIKFKQNDIQHVAIASKPFQILSPCWSLHPSAPGKRHCQVGTSWVEFLHRKKTLWKSTWPWNHELFWIMLYEEGQFLLMKIDHRKSSQKTSFARRVNCLRSSAISDKL